MKRALLALAAIVMIAAGVLSFVQQRGQQSEDFTRGPALLGEATVLPPSAGTIDPRQLTGIIESAAADTGVNVFRTASGFVDGSEFITQYVLLTGQTRLFSLYPLAAGRTLTPEETRGTYGSGGQDGGAIATLSSTADAHPRPVGVISVLGADPHLTIAPLGEAFRTFPASGSYTVECAHPAACERYRATVAAALSAASGTPLTAGDLLARGSGAGAVASGWSQVLTLGLWCLIAVLALLCAYRQLAESKRSGVLLLFGASALGLWWRITGAPVVITVALTGIAEIVIAAAWPGGGAVLAGTVALHVGIIAAVTLGASATVLPVIGVMSVAGALRQERHTGTMFWFSTVVTSGVMALAILFGTATWAHLGSALASAERLQGWTEASDFASFTPTLVGRDGAWSAAAEEESTRSEAGPLYEALNHDGAVYIERISTEVGTTPDGAEDSSPPDVPSPDANTVTAGDAEVVVNPNYLAAFPLRDSTGARVRVPESESRWTVLISADRRADEAEIRASIAETRSLITDADVSPAAINVIWLAPNQEVFTFSPDGGLTDPRLAVVTLANSVPFDRANAIGGSAEGALHVALHGRSTTEVLRSIQPLLTSLHLEDNLTSLLTGTEQAQAQLAQLHADTVRSLWVGAALLLLVLLLTAHNATLQFDRFAHRIVVRGLFGMRTLGRYREWARTLAITLGVVAVGVLIGAAVGVTSAFGFTTAGDMATRTQQALVLLVVCVVAQAGASAIILRWTEFRRRLTIVKGGTL